MTNQVSSSGQTKKRSSLGVLYFAVASAAIGGLLFVVWWNRVVVSETITGWRSAIGLAAPAKPSQGGDSKKSGNRPVAVGVATSVQRDLPVYLSGIGTVTALNTVTVKSRVDGELIKVSLVEGQTVESGELLAEIDPRPFEAALAQAEGQLARDRATLQLSKQTLSRLQSLKLQNATSQQELDEQQSLVEQSEAVVAIGLANVQNAQLQLSYTRITSPISGRVGLRLIDKGNIVKANDLGGLAVITQVSPISVVFAIPQDSIPLLQSSMKQKEQLIVEAFDRDVSTRLAEGKLTAIDNQVDPTTGTLKLKATFENAEQTLFPNQFVNARLRIDTVRDAIVVPSLAVQRGPDYRYVYVVKSDETVELRKVELGPIDGSESSITKGLAVGETVVVTGLDKLQPNTKVILPKRKTDSAG
jgi:membrane fusion protein, multidrug efflux system